MAPVLQQVVESFDCNLVEGVFSHELKQFVIDGNKCVLNKPGPEAKVAEDTFQENEVYAVDIVVSTGDGKTRILDEKETTVRFPPLTASCLEKSLKPRRSGSYSGGRLQRDAGRLLSTGVRFKPSDRMQVYKRVAGEGYKLKLSASRAVFSEIIRRHPSLPFTLRGLEAKNARLGLVECVNHDLLQPYPVLHEKPNTLVAHFKTTVLLMPNGSDRITSAPVQELKSEKQVSLPHLACPRY